MNSNNIANRLVDKIQTIVSNPHYRVADVFYRKGWRYTDSQQNVFMLPEFEGTILKNYLLRVNDIDTPCFKTLTEVCHEFYKQSSITPACAETLVIHVRAGDVIDNNWFLQTPFKENIERYTKNSKIKRCVFVACFAFQEYKENNAWMFSPEKLNGNKQRLYRLFKELVDYFPAIEFDVYSNLNQDNDLIYMLLSEHFLPDKGGFSDLVCDLREYSATGIQKSFPEDNELQKIQRMFNAYHIGEVDTKDIDGLIKNLRELKLPHLANWVIESENSKGNIV